MAQEVELKLELTAEAAETLAASALLASDFTDARQRSIYFDTTDHRLENAGLTLRIRKTGRKRVQTVKAGGRAAGLFARSEWEQAVRTDTPVIDDTTPIRTLLGETAAQIAPVFEVRMHRRTWIIEEGGATIELVIDRGEAVEGDRRSDICEIELELKAGDPAALFALARKIDAIAPVRLGVLTKAARGYGLVGPIVTAFKAEPVRLDRGMTAAQAFQHIAQACVRQFRLNERLLQDGRDPAALHQARVALRRLRSAFSIFKSMLDDEAGAQLREDLRWLASELGDARNLDVLLERAKPGVLHDSLHKARDEAYDLVDQALASTRARTLMLDLAQWTASGAWLAASENREVREQPARDFAGEALDRFRRKVKKGGRDLAAEDEARHEVRKDAKKLRYAAEFFTALFDSASRRTIGDSFGRSWWIGDNRRPEPVRLSSDFPSGS